ncbi:MAG: hypothetical protein JWL61_2374 [Gemmatimonadetes bacterium]|nr:hypothetical protein [Gemmatimonadota bacterium]
MLTLLIATARRIVLASAFGLCASPWALAAQRTARDSTDAYWEIHWSVGAYMPLGQQRLTMANAPYYRLAALVAPIREIALVASTGWVPTHHRERDVVESVDITEIQGGIEVRPYAIKRGVIVVKPFTEIGLGARSYSRRGVSTPVTTEVTPDITTLAGYTSLGLACEYAATGIRISVRSHMSAYDGVDGRSQGSIRHEVSFTIGVIARAVP